MGQKVNPHGLRVGVIKGWDAKWYADKKTFADNLVEDNKIREFVKKELFSAYKKQPLIQRQMSFPESGLQMRRSVKKRLQNLFH